MLNNAARPRCCKVTAVSCSLSDVGHPWIINSYVSPAVRPVGPALNELHYPWGEGKEKGTSAGTKGWRLGICYFDVQLLPSRKPRDWFERLKRCELSGMGGLIKVVRSRSLPSEGEFSEEDFPKFPTPRNVLALLVNGPLTTIAINRRIIPKSFSRD